MFAIFVQGHSLDLHLVTEHFSSVSGFFLKIATNVEVE